MSKLATLQVWNAASWFDLQTVSAILMAWISIAPTATRCMVNKLMFEAASGLGCHQPTFTKQQHSAETLGWKFIEKWDRLRVAYLTMHKNHRGSPALKTLLFLPRPERALPKTACFLKLPLLPVCRERERRKSQRSSSFPESLVAFGYLSGHLLNQLMFLAGEVSQR